MPQIPPSTQKRILRELSDLHQNPQEEYSASPITPTNLLRWTGTIHGPDSTPYAKGIFHLTILFPTDYPHNPPHITFKTPVYHPNIDQDGEISLNILGREWCPALTIGKVLLSICSFLDDPYGDDPDGSVALVPEITALYRTDRGRYEEVVREWTERYARGS